MRIRLYGVVANSVEEFSIRLTKAFQQTSFDEKLATYDEVFKSLTEVRTYGATEVVGAANTRRCCRSS